jgi:predicted AAA+ superfamily ATPase
MKYIPRQIPDSKNTGSFFLFGPRGTGKTLWLQKQYPDSLYVNLLLPETRRRLEAVPDRLRELIGGAFGTDTIVIDEIQRIPALLDLVHHLIEERKDLRFILTGSSSRKLKQSGVNLLAGRASLRKCHPFMFSELQDVIDPEVALTIGTIPLILDSPNPEESLAGYVDLYLKEEIQQEGFVRNLGDFSRFLETVSFSHGSVLNQSEVARESEIERKTVAGYFGILEDMMLSHHLPVFTKRAKRQLIRHEKFYLFDAGIFRQLRPKGPLDRPSEIDGMALEGLVMQNLRAWADYSAEDIGLSYWRTKSGTEVDFVVYGETTFIAIEVKNSDRVRKSHLKGLKAFLEDYPEATGYLLYRGVDVLMIDGILCLPWNRFLTNLRVDQAVIPDRF